MYIALDDNMKKAYYREIVERALKITKEELIATPSLSLYKSFYNQLIDIKKTVIEENYVYSEDEANEKYPLGVMAIRAFDGYEGFEYADMLIDISYGISLYPTMPE